MLHGSTINYKVRLCLVRILFNTVSIHYKQGLLYGIILAVPSF